MKKPTNMETECPICKGTGYIWSSEMPGLRKRCDNCDGSGSMERREYITGEIMRWLTNGHKSEEAELIRSMSAGHDQPIVTGRPRSGKYSIEELENTGLIGFYRVGECHCQLCEEQRAETRRDPLGAWRKWNGRD